MRRIGHTLLALSAVAWVAVVLAWAWTWLAGLSVLSSWTFRGAPGADVPYQYRQGVWVVIARRGGVLVDRQRYWYAGPYSGGIADGTWWSKDHGPYPTFPRYGPPHVYRVDGRGFQWVTAVDSRPRSRNERWVIGFPLWPILLVLGVPALVAFRTWRAAWVRRRRRRTGQCIACGYDLRGIPENPCPECGTVSSRSDYVSSSPSSASSSTASSPSSSR